MSRNSKEAKARAEELAESLSPGTTVVAWAKGYPRWPAVVVGADDVPESVKSAKPRRKVVVPVLFYNDNSFMWVEPDETEPLPTERAKKLSQARVKRTLKDAYAMAASPPPYKKLLAIATGASEEDSPAEAEPVNAEPEAEATPQPEPAPRSRRARSAAAQAAEQAPQRATRGSENVRERGTARKRGAAAAAAATQSPKEESPAPAPAPASAKRSKRAGGAKTDSSVEPSPAPVPAPQDEAEDDSEYVDNGTEETEDSASTSAETDGGVGSEDLARSQSARLSLCSSVRETVQQQILLPSTVDSTQISGAKEALALLDDVPQVEICVVRRSKLLQVLVSVLKREGLPSDLHAKLAALVERWSTKAEPVIRGIPEALAPKEETEEPEDYDEPSRDASEAPKELNSEPNSEPTSLPEEEPEEPKEETKEPEEPKEESKEESKEETNGMVNGEANGEANGEPNGDLPAEPSER